MKLESDVQVECQVSYNKLRLQQLKMNKTVINTWQYEEDSGNKCQDSALWTNMAHVAKDEGSENKEQRHHGERSSCPHHFWERTKHIRCVSLSKKNQNFHITRFTHWEYLPCFLLWSLFLAQWNTPRPHIFLSLNLRGDRTQQEDNEKETKRKWNGGKYWSTYIQLEHTNWTKPYVYNPD